MKIIEKISDIKVALIATIIPLILMIFWHLNNIGLPVADAVDFLGASGKIVNDFYDGNLGEGLYSLYADKPWRPVSFYLFLFPLMLISGNNILFTFAAIHSLALFITVIYSYYILRTVNSSKSICFLGALVIGTLSHSFFPGGAQVFAETMLTPAVLATIFHLIKSNYMINKRDSIFALIAMTVCFTMRPIEAIIYLLPIIICFFYFGIRKKIFEFNQLAKIMQFIFALFLLAAIFKGMDISFDAKEQIKSLHNGQAEKLYITIVKYFSIIVFIVFIPNVIKSFKNLFFWIRYSKNNNKESYVVIIFTSLAFLIFIWFIESWRDLYIWIYQTNFGQVARANELADHFFNIPISINDIYIRFFDQLKVSGLLPFIIIFFLTIFSLFYKIYFKIKDDKKIYHYIFLSSIVATIPILITISNTSRKFALTYILFILLGILIITSLKKFNKISKNVFLFLALFQITSISAIISGTNFFVFDKSEKTISLLKKIDGNFNGYNLVSGANIMNPINYSFEPRIANLIDESANNLKYDHSRIELSFMYSTLHKQGRLDIFTTNLLLNLAAYKKSYYSSLPIVLDGYSDKMLINNILNNDGFFLVNPYGNMSMTQENLAIFHNKLNKFDNLNQSKFPQDFYYENLMLLYFSGKLTNQYNFKKYKCIDLSHRNYVREGCLLIKNSIKSK